MTEGDSNKKGAAKQQSKSKSPGPRNRNRNARSKSPTPGGQQGGGGGKGKSKSPRRNQNRGKGKGNKSKSPTRPQKKDSEEKVNATPSLAALGQQKAASKDPQNGAPASENAKGDNDKQQAMLARLENEKLAQERFMQKQKEMADRKDRMEAEETAEEAKKAAAPGPMLLVDGLFVAFSNDYLSCKRNASMDVVLTANVMNKEASYNAKPLPTTSNSNSSGLKSQLTPAFFCDPALTYIVAKAKSTEFVSARGRQQQTQAKKEAKGPQKSPGPKVRKKNKSKSPRRNKKSPVRPKKAVAKKAAEQSIGNKTLAKEPVSATKKLPLHVQFDPFLLGMVGATKKNPTNTEQTLKVLSLPTTKEAPKPNDIVVAPLKLPLSYLEVDPLISQMVPPDIAEAINLELSKKWEEQEMLEEEEEEEKVMVTPNKPRAGDRAAADEFYMTPPKDFKGKMAFFEKLTKQSAKKRVVKKDVSAELPKNMTPVAEKRVKVEKFFDKVDLPKLPPKAALAKEEPAKANGKANQGRGTSPKRNKGRSRSPKRNKGKSKSPARPKKTGSETTEEKAPSPASVETPPAAKEKEAKPAEKEPTSAPVEKKEATPAPAKEEAPIGKEPTPAPEEKKPAQAPTPAPVEEKPNSAPVVEKEPAPAPVEAKAPEPAQANNNNKKGRGKSPRRKKGKSKSPARQKKAETEKPAADAAEPATNEKAPVSASVEEKFSAPSIEKAAAPAASKTVEKGGEKQAEPEPEPPKVDPAETKPKNKAAPIVTKPADKPEETSDLTAPDVLQDKTNKETKSPKSPLPDAGVSSTEQLKPEVLADVSTEEVHGELLSRDIAAEVLEDSEDVDDQANKPVEEFPSLGVTPRGPKPSVKAQKSKSYAQILSEGKKRKKERSETAQYPEYLDFIPQLSFEQKLSFTGTGILDSAKENKGSADKPRASVGPGMTSKVVVESGEAERVKMEEIAQRLAEGTPQKKLKHKVGNYGPVEESKEEVDDSGPVEESKEEIHVDPGFKPIKREPKKKKSVADDGQESSQPSLPSDKGSQSKPLEVVDPVKAAFKKDNFNQFDALVDELGDIPTEIVATEESKKQKTRPLKTGTQTKKKKSVHFGGAAAKESKGATKARGVKAKGAKDKSMDDDDIALAEATQSQPLLTMPLHFVNNLAHTKPVCYILDGIFWAIALLMGAPFGAVGIVLITVYKLLMFFPRTLGLGIIKPKKTPDQKLGVVITGCDSGFGKDLSFKLLEEGFVVFCGCLRKESLKAFAKEKGAIPMLMDITKDIDVDKASKQVLDWLSKEDGRILHALVNNAGIGTPGLVDWVTVGEMQKMVDVNFLGMVRCTKKLLPVFKSQAAEGSYSSARIVNMVSIAGMVSGGLFSVGYEASKHAAEVFSTNLRLEMQSFGLKVAVINPSFHKTEMTKDLSVDLKKKWKYLTPEKRREYGGDEYINLAVNASKVASQVVNWDSQNVVDAMQKSVVLKSPPPRLLVGGDAKYLLVVMRMLPTWVSSRLLSIKSSRLTRTIKKNKQA